MVLNDICYGDQSDLRDSSIREKGIDNTIGPVDCYWL